MKTVRFWQRIVTPHLIGLAGALARRGYSIEFVAEDQLTPDRAAMGWEVIVPEGVSVSFIGNRAETFQAVRTATPGTIHVTQGLRSNGLVAHAQSEISRRGDRHLVVMETVDDSGPKGFVKRSAYKWIIANTRSGLEGILAIGHQTSNWLVEQGMPMGAVHPFAYFLPDHLHSAVGLESNVFRFIFVGQLIPRKQVDELIHALADTGLSNFELVIVGSGPEERYLRALANKRLSGKVTWLGTLRQSVVPSYISESDCLVLPSRHDGWGAVISEALMVGTPTICSWACGAAGAASASGCGGVFPAGDRAALTKLLYEQVENGRRSSAKREILKNWAKCLGADAGAAYLDAILNNVAGNSKVLAPPWLSN